MANNYSPEEVVQIARNMSQYPTEVVEDVLKRYPFLAGNANTEAGLVAIISGIPAMISGRQVNNGIKNGVDRDSVLSDEEIEAAAPETEEEAEVEVKKEKKKTSQKKSNAKSTTKTKSKTKAKPAPEPVIDDDDEMIEDEEKALADMSVDELKAKAKELKVSLKGLKKKSQVVAAIQEALDATAGESEDEDWDI